MLKDVFWRFSTYLSKSLIEPEALNMDLIEYVGWSNTYLKAIHVPLAFDMNTAINLSFGAIFFSKCICAWSAQPDPYSPWDSEKPIVLHMRLLSCEQALLMMEMSREKTIWKK